MNNYLVYNLCDNNNNNYYGYTDNWKVRWRVHKADKKRNASCSSKKLDLDNTIITIIERGLSKEFSKIWEKFYIQNYECVNIHKYNFNKKEWSKKDYEKHKEEMKEYYEKHKERIKERNEKNKERIKERDGKPWHCSLCDCNIRWGEKSRHCKSKKHINNIK